MDRLELLRRIAAVGERPFRAEVTKSVWDPVLDVPGLHREAKDRVLALVRGLGHADAPRCLVVKAAPGYGKTHVLGWTRQQFEESHEAAFVYVEPYRLDHGSWERHLLVAVLDGLFHSSRSQRAILEERLRAQLVTTYDQLARTRAGRSALGISRSLIQIAFGQYPAIREQDADYQRRCLQPAITQPGFMARVFAKFDELYPPHPDGVRLDRDALRAACLLAFGDDSQRRTAERWFRGQPVPPGDEPNPPFEEACATLPKMRNAVWTLSRLAKQPLCLAFDQLEDVYHAFQQTGQAREQLQRMTAVLEAFYRAPDLCFLFFVQESHWLSFFSREVDPHFYRRMTEGHEPLTLTELDDASAKELVWRRMDAYVWRPLKLKPPADQPCFPFTEEEIRTLRQANRGPAHAFIRAVRERCRQYLREAEKPVVVELPPLRLTRIEPASCVHDERAPVEIHGENIPEQATVQFGERAAERVQCVPARGVINVCPPVGEPGQVEVLVTAADGRRATIAFQFRERERPADFWKRIDLKKLKKAREARGWTQREVGEKIGATQARVSQAERGEVHSNAIYLKLAECYSMPIEDLLKDAVEAAAPTGS